MNCRWKLYSSRFFVCLLMFLSACTASPSPQEPEITLRLGINTWIGWAPIYIAVANNFFEEEGVNVEIVYYEAANNHEADFATRNLDMIAAVYTDGLSQISAGVMQQAIWIFDSSDGADVFVANSQIDSPEDLRGQTIGLDYGTFGHIFVLEGLRLYGLSTEDVTLASYSPEEIPAAIASGQIVAGHTWDPYLSEVLNAGGNILFSSADTPGIILDTLRVHSRIVQNNPEAVAAVVRAIARGRSWWTEHPSEGDAIVAEALGLKPEDIPSLSTGVHLFTVEDNILAFSEDADSNNSIYHSAQIVVDLALSNELIETAPDISSSINPDFVLSLANR